MGRSVRLAAYRALSWRNDRGRSPPDVPRPPGRLVWIHVAEPENGPAVEDLAARLRKTRPELSILMTVTQAEALQQAACGGASCAGLFREPVPSEHPDAVVRFLKHWRPDLCLWSWGGLRPNLVAETAARGCRMILFDADKAGFDPRRDRWVTDLSRQLLGGFARCTARGPEALQRLESLGVPRTRLTLAAPLRPCGTPLPCNDRDLADLRNGLAGRPLWFAAGAQADEVDMVLEAHRHALRLSHRLLLMVHPADAAAAALCRAGAEARGWRLSDWTAGDDVDETTQLLMAEDPEMLGLLYRVAPVSFLGSSLTPGFGGRNPFEAAALGSAILYGPNVRNFLSFYSRLATAGAARMVKDADSLGVAVTRLIAPDQAAAMARAGWDVVSEGAETMDDLLARIDETLSAAADDANAPA